MNWVDLKSKKHAANWICWDFYRQNKVDVRKFCFLEELPGWPEVKKFSKIPKSHEKNFIAEKILWIRTSAFEVKFIGGNLFDLTAEFLSFLDMRHIRYVLYRYFYLKLWNFWILWNFELPAEVSRSQIAENSAFWYHKYFISSKWMESTLV